MIAETEFSNPERLPAELLSLPVTSGGVIRSIKALLSQHKKAGPKRATRGGAGRGRQCAWTLDPLSYAVTTDPYWVEQREWRPYWRPPTEASVVGALDAWTSNANAILEDLKFLLSLRHHRFWSHMLHEPRCMDMLVSFLQEAQPPYLPEEHSPSPVYQELYRRVATIFCRLVTERESHTEWMTREYLGGVIYDMYLFSIPTLWDLCLLYGIENPQPIGRLVRAVFTLQPRYHADSETAVAFLQEVFKYTIVQVNHKDDGTLEPPNLPETFKGFGEIKRPQNNRNGADNLTLNVLKDLVLHLLDSSLTIRTFVEVYPPAVETLKKRNFVLSIVQLYENGIPCLYEHLDELLQESSAGHQEVTAQLETLRSQLVDIVREVLAAETDAILTQQGNPESHVAAYFSTMMDVLSEKIFIRDYNNAYPVHDDLEMLRQAYPDMDSVKIDFILQAVYSNLDEPTPTIRELTPSTSNFSQLAEPSKQETPIDNDISSKLKEESLISEVKDILPHLGEGFILKCLQHYGFKTDKVINSVLEGTLDASLLSLDRSLPIIPDDPLDQKYLETGVARLNIFDGDEFDIMSRDDVDVSRIHIGKRKEKFKDLKQMMEDKSHVRQRMDIYSKYNLVVEDENMYSDEYDDTYDAAPGGVAGRDDLPDERRPLVKPRVLQQMELQSESSSEEEEPSAPAAPTATSSGRRIIDAKPMDFCVNPEETRARREAQRRANQKPVRPPPKGGDVVGKAKGQGQEKDVLLNRERKNQNKSSRGNHNRRQGAQWKRTQGLLPS